MASGTQHETELLDQVIVRFAGDSGDGMQLTGDRFTTSSALLGNDLSTFPDFPAEIRAPAGTVNGVSAFQVHISDHDILTPGDSPNVLVAMNPAALKANIELMAKGTVLIVNSDSFEERDLAKAGYAENPLTDGSLAAYTVYEVPDDLHHPGGLQGGRGQAPRRRALQELLRAGPHQLDVHPSRRADGRVDRRALRQPAPGGRRQHPGLPGRLRLRRDGRALRVQLRGPARHLREGRVRPGHRQPGAGLGPHRRLPAGRPAPVPRELPDHAGLGHPPRAEPAQGVRRPHLPGRGRDRRHRRRPGRLLRRRPRRHHDQRPGPRPQVRDDRPGHQPRAAARHRRRAAGRALDRAADQDRAGRPAARHVRPPRRGAPADPGAPDARATASPSPSRRSGWR